MTQNPSHALPSKSGSPSLLATIEGQNVDRKSLRKVTGKTADFSELAKDCVCFATVLAASC